MTLLGLFTYLRFFFFQLSLYYCGTNARALITTRLRYYTAVRGVATSSNSIVTRHYQNWRPKIKVLLLSRGKAGSTNQCSTSPWEFKYIKKGSYAVVERLDPQRVLSHVRNGSFCLHFCLRKRKKKKNKKTFIYSYDTLWQLYL